MMTRIKLVAVFALLGLGAATMQGQQVSRTWVSSLGSDSNPCSRTAPCQTFAGALAQTLPGGEIDVLDPGGFGTLTITKSITLDGGGGQVASVLAAGTNGIVVAAGAGDVVIIRNLRLDGLLGNGSNSGNAGINGIRWISGKTLIIENCVIFGFNSNGIDIEKNDGGNAFIMNTSVENNGPGTNQTGGVFSLNTASTVTIAIDHLMAAYNQNGVLAKDFSKVSIRDSNASNNITDGFVVQVNVNQATMDIADSQASHNGVAGIQAGGGGGPSTMSITSVSSFDNTWGFIVGVNGVINTFGNNYINTNTNIGTLSNTFGPR